MKTLTKGEEINKNMIAQLSLILLSFELQRASLNGSEVSQTDSKRAINIKHTLRKLIKN